MQHNSKQKISGSYLMFPLNKSLTQSPLILTGRPEVFCKKGVLRNFTKFTGIHLYRSLFFNKKEFIKTTLLKKA